MKITPEMAVEDERRWHARDVVAELGYCGNGMRDRKDMTNLDIRFYAYIMRKAYDMLKEQEPKVLEPDEVRKCDCAVWLEDVDKKEVVLAIGDVFISNKARFLVKGNRHCIVNFDDYGMRWRAWAKKPTDEQRAAVPWEEG